MSGKIVRTLAAAAALLLCTAVLAACGKTNGAEKSDNASSDNTTASESPAPVTKAPDENKVDPAVPVNLDEGVSDKMYGRAIMSEGNLARLAAVMKKAKNGEEITVGVIGGSITQGSLASKPSNCYASKFSEWWKNKFPDAKVNFVNAGIGGTDSYLGVHRVDGQLLAHDPDAVIVEFSVNDTDDILNGYSYDSLVRKILSHGTKPAVMLLFTTMDNGTSLQDTHKDTGKAYDLPMISYHDAVYPEVEAGTLSWADISPDNIHPNDAGHDIIAQILSCYLDGVYDRLDEITEEPADFPDKPTARDLFVNARTVSAADIEPVSMEGFESVEKDFYEQFPNNWKTASGGSLTFEIECRNFGVFFMRTTDGKSGDYEVYVDGEMKTVLDGDFAGGWGNYGSTKSALLGMETVKHTIEIKPAKGSEEKGITILGLMVS